ncbi:MAG: isoprenyl transferase [Bacteroidales bacterium]|nr:isoprenyl transferase [Bacteroidales bacterium]
MIMHTSRELNMSKIPCHIAVIMDGNGRWAQQRGHERTYGHKAGLDAVRSVIEGAGEMGVKYLTLYTFSTENWNRPKEEVDMLMGLLAQSIHNELEELMAKHVRLLIQGRMQDLPESCHDAMQSAIDQTANNDGLTLILALSYSGRTEITRAAKAIAQEVSQGTLRVEDIQPDTITQHLYHSDVPDPDMLIRTGGECRISNFLLWQMAYTEFFFVPVMWPDFRKEDLREIIIDFQSRERRYGKTGMQVREH